MLRNCGASGFRVGRKRAPLDVDRTGKADFRRFGCIKWRSLLLHEADHSSMPQLPFTTVFTFEVDTCLVNHQNTTHTNTGRAGIAQTDGPLSTATRIVLVNLAARALQLLRVHRLHRRYLFSTTWGVRQHSGGQLNSLALPDSHATYVCNTVFHRKACVYRHADCRG